MLEDFAAALPPGVVNVVCGDGDTVVGPLMASGQIDVLAFIGSARVANLANKKGPGGMGYTGAELNCTRPYDAISSANTF
jgi:acyl-CoA reductase-like NAD-dependent aldehyde dehydrogenase